MNFGTGIPKPSTVLSSCRSLDGQCVALASMDGYCSVGTFQPGELGQPVPLLADETAAEEAADKSAAAAAAAAAPGEATETAAQPSPAVQPVSAPSDETPVGYWGGETGKSCALG